MKQKITVDGVDREIDLPDDATPDEIDEIVNQEMSGTPDAAPEPTPEPAKPSIMDKALDAGFPLSRSISRSMKPGIGRDLLANAGTALDVLSAPFRAIDAGINEISKPVNKLTGVSGSYEEGKQAIAGMIPGKGVVSNLARTGVDMALSPSSYVPAGAIGKMMRTPVQKVESEMAKQLSMKTPRAAPAAIPQKTEDMTLKEVEKGGGPIEQATGEVIDASKVPQQGLPMLRDLSESERRIMSEPKAPNTIPFSEYAKQSVLKKKNVQAAQPNQLAATNASKAFEEVDMMRKDAGKKLQEVIDANPDAVIDISSAKQEYLQMVNDRIQPMIKGEIAADPSAVKLSEEIGNMLLNLPDQISAKVGVNLKRNLQNRVKYDAEGQLRPVNGLLEGITKATAGSIDGSLDKALKGFKEANEAYGKTSQLRNNMSKVLGKEISETTGLTKHGASIMKRAIESNADSGISELFRQVKEMTGGKYDLFQDASYASIAMKHSGDVRQVQMALPFGGALTAAMGHPTGILDIAKKSGEAIGAIRGGNQLARIDKWHTKQQAKNPGSTVADFAAKKTPVDQSKLSDQVKPGQSVAEFVAESQKKGATPAGKKTGTMADRLREIGKNAANRIGNERGAVGGAFATPRRYEYDLQYRPFGTATVPKGYVDVSKTKNEFGFETVSYDKPLSRKDQEAFQLSPKDPQDPVNIKKAVESARNSVDELTKYGEKGYESVSSDGTKRIYTPDVREGGDAWRVTYINKDGTPTGHVPFKSYVEARDEIARNLAYTERTASPNSGAFSRGAIGGAAKQFDALPISEKIAITEKQIADLKAKKYLPNSNKVSVGGVDELDNSKTMTIGSINENKRRKELDFLNRTLEEYKAEAAARVQTGVPAGAPKITAPTGDFSKLDFDPFELFGNERGAVGGASPTKGTLSLSRTNKDGKPAILVTVTGNIGNEFRAKLDALNMLPVVDMANRRQITVTSPAELDAIRKALVEQGIIDGPNKSAAGSGAVPMLAGMAAAGVGGLTAYHAFMKKREQARNKK